MRVIRLNVGPMDNNTYVLLDEPTGQAAVVDPSFGAAEAVARWQRAYAQEAAGSRPPAVVALVLNTHGHLDHTVENAAVVEQTGAPLAIHEADVPLLEALDEQAAWFGIEAPPAVTPGRLLADGDTIELGGSSAQVAHTPGHSPGGICLVGPGWVITGDTLFADSIGRTDLYGGSLDALMASIRDRLLPLPPDTRLYPGHGPETTIGRERRYNPFLTDL